MVAEDIAQVHRARLGAVLASLLLITIAACSKDPGLGPFRDETRDDLALAEAQQLTPAVICLPAFMPPGIGPEPVIGWRAEWDHPDDPTVHLRYYTTDGELPVVHIEEQYDTRSWPPFDPGSDNSEVAYDLLAWMVFGWRPPKDQEQYARLRQAFDDARKKAEIQVTFATGGDGREYVVCQVLNPPEFRGTALWWKQVPIDYRLYARLGPEEAMAIAESIPRCGPNPQPTVTRTPTPERR